MASFLLHLSIVLAILVASHCFSAVPRLARCDQLQLIGSRPQRQLMHLRLDYGNDRSCCEDVTDHDVPMPSRRAIVAAASSILLTPSPYIAAASTSPEDRIYVIGTATLQPGLSIDESIGSNAALYVTARPNRPDNVPRAILDGSRGKPPPVLSARFSNPSFPFEFTLTSQNYTPEGASKVVGGGGVGDEGTTATSGKADEVWWEGDDLIVSARFDSDGVAATRDPTDLVGRGIYSATAGGSSVPIELVGRGLFGKSVTAKK
ncbi:hypothetical protein ACHAWF_015027 [Thalassiosira exigua]